MNLRSFLHYLLATQLITLVPFFFQLHNTPKFETAQSAIYGISIFGYFGLLIALILTTIFLIQKIIKPLHIALPIIGALWILYWILDITVFNFYYFHLDGLLLKMFFFDFTGMGLPMFVLVVIFALVAFTFLLNIFLAKRCKNTHPLKIKTLLFIQFFIIFGLFFVNSIISIWAKSYSRDEILTHNKYFPYFAPVTDHKLGLTLHAKFPTVFPSSTRENTSLSNTTITGGIKYPSNPMQCTLKNNAPNILLIALESWQSDTLNETVMPKTIKTLEKGGTLFKNHISGGTATIPGLFSLFLGIEPSYYSLFKSSPNKNTSIIVNELKKSNYDINLFTQSDFNRFNLRNLILPNIVGNHYTETKNDEDTLSKVKQSNLSTTKSHQPFFDFVFYTSSHSPYKYPEKFTKFTPLPQIEGGYLMNKHADNTTYKNDYFNSLYYLDDMIGETLKSYEQSGLLNNTIIIITGDHAEEFNETGKGYWGHGSNFTKWQNHVPLAIIKPSDTSLTIKNERTFHKDIMPTLLQTVYQCKNPVEDYSTGQNIYRVNQNRNTILSSYYDDAYLINDIVYEKNRGRTYHWEDMSPEDKKTPPIKPFKALLDLQTRFIKK